MIKGIKPSLAQAGAIKIGKLSENERTAGSGRKWRPPVKLDHFLVTKTTRGEDGNLEVDDGMMEELANQGFDDSDKKIRSIPILLHSDSIDDVFPTVYAWYSGKQVVCRGDGEKATRWEVKDAKKTGRTKEIACPCELLERDAKGAQKCKPHGVLHCTVALPGRAVAGAVYRYRTTGIISVQRIIGSLEQILAIIGTITNVPLVLRVTPVQVTPDGRTQTVYSVHVEFRQEIIGAQQAAIAAREARAKLGAPSVEIRALLQAPASDAESPEEQAEVEAEFYPPEDAPALEPEPAGRTQAVKDAAKKTASKGKALSAEETKKALEEAKAAKAEAEPEPEPDTDAPDYGEPDVDF
ncbi:MAG TPA: hypothetical protein VFH61_15140 [Thermoleophilia bacterium]|nr:hypothetical protein [Thermoleophilia bacterium]